MKTFIFLSFTLSIVFLIFSCNKSKDDWPEECEKYIAGNHKDGKFGYSFAVGSYQDLDGTATFVNTGKRSLDSDGWIIDPLKKGIRFASIDGYCFEKVKIVLRYITINKGEKISIKKTTYGMPNDFPQSSLYYKDVGSIIEVYELLIDNDNWLIIDKINSDTTEIEGRFNLSFITSREDYLSGERERWDDPNRPDTLHFTNDKFRAAFFSY